MLFGGAAGTSYNAIGDTWRLDGGVWTQLQPGSSPTARVGAGAAYDDATGSTVLYGGFNDAGFPLGDTWVWTNGTWSIATQTGPTPNLSSGFALTNDPLHRAVVLFGNANGVADTWVWAPITPTITSVSPSVGPAAGGPTVTINGTHFLGATSVMFGAVPATSFTVNTDGQIVATIPSGSAGTVDVQITANGLPSAATAGDQFTYLNAPTIAAISPSSGPAGGATTVAITGTNFITCRPGERRSPLVASRRQTSPVPARRRAWRPVPPDPVQSIWWRRPLVDRVHLLEQIASPDIPLDRDGRQPEHWPRGRWHGGDNHQQLTLYDDRSDDDRFWWRCRDAA